MHMSTLEQWRFLAAVVDQGGFAAAAEHLRKSQSTVSHAVKQLQAALGVRLIALQGRRAVLTPAGETLLRRARHLLADAEALQRLATTLAQGWEARVTLAVDVVFPREALFGALAAFGRESPETRVELLETVLSTLERLSARCALRIRMAAENASALRRLVLPHAHRAKRCDCFQTLTSTVLVHDFLMASLLTAAPQPLVMRRTVKTATTRAPRSILTLPRSVMASTMTATTALTGQVQISNAAAMATTVSRRNASRDARRSQLPSAAHWWRMPSCVHRQTAS